MAQASAARVAVTPIDPKHPAFMVRPMTGYDVATWQMSEKLTNWDAMFALGFTSYQALQKFLREKNDQPVDEVRELLVRLYKIDPTYPIHFQAPSMPLLVDYLFNLTSTNSALGEENRKKCGSLLSKLLGRNRGSGYRWLRSSEVAENSVALPVRRMISKVFSMNEQTARPLFWRAAFAMADARGIDVNPIRELLRVNGVAIG